MASTDSLADNTAFATKNAASFPILADPEKKMTRDYGALMAGALPSDGPSSLIRRASLFQSIHPSRRGLPGPIW